MWCSPRSWIACSDRLSMHWTSFAQLQEAGISLHMIDLGGDVTGNGISKLVFTILSAVAEAERDRKWDRFWKLLTREANCWSLRMREPALKAFFTIWLHVNSGRR